MLADSIADEPARTEGVQETAGSSRSTIILKAVPMVPNVQAVNTNQDWQDRFNSVLCVMKKNSDISPRRR